jgi:hypothetical protein
MSFVAVAIGGSAIIGGGVGLYAANKAADTQAEAGRNALAFQSKQFDTAQTNFKPYMDVGSKATYTLGSLMGQNGQKPDYSSFYNSPDYAFAQQQGEQGIERGANARGMNLSGGTLRDLSSFNSGLATQQYGNYYNRLMGLSQLGQASAAGSASTGTTAAGQIGNTMQGIGQSQASGIVGGANALTGSLNSGVSNSLLANYLKGPSAYAGAGGVGGGIGGSTSSIGYGGVQMPVYG